MDIPGDRESDPVREALRGQLDWMAVAQEVDPLDKSREDGAPLGRRNYAPAPSHSARSAF